MLTIQVRLGRDIMEVDGRFDEAITVFLSTLRDDVVHTGIASNIGIVKMEVHHDEHGWDENVEQIKISVTIELNDHARESCHSWLKSLTTCIDVDLERIGVPIDLVEHFQIALIIGGHHIGTVRQRVEGEASNWVTDWCDEELKPETRRLRGIGGVALLSLGDA